MRVIYVTGDATHPKIHPSNDATYLIHLCNDKGYWGKGFVLAVSKRWPVTKRAYKKWAEEHKPKRLPLGEIQVLEVEPNFFVVNMIGQCNIQYQSIGNIPIRYPAIVECLKNLRIEMRLAKHESPAIHCPRFGCSLAGGEWNKILACLKEAFDTATIDIYVYDPVSEEVK